MDWINRNIDGPLLEGAARSLHLWHGRTGRSPEDLEHIWTLVVLSLLFLACRFEWTGSAFLLGCAGLFLLAVPSVWSLLLATKSKPLPYDAARYKALRARSQMKRDGEWSIRLIILAAAVILPFVDTGDDPLAARFLFGAGLWFVLVAPAKFYLQAAEPPKPDQGDASYSGRLQFQ